MIVKYITTFIDAISVLIDSTSVRQRTHELPPVLLRIGPFELIKLPTYSILINLPFSSFHHA